MRGRFGLFLAVIVSAIVFGACLSVDPHHRVLLHAGRPDDPTINSGRLYSFIGTEALPRLLEEIVWLNF